MGDRNRKEGAFLRGKNVSELRTEKSEGKTVGPKTLPRVGASRRKSGPCLTRGVIGGASFFEEFPREGDQLFQKVERRIGAQRC